jgi:hypothetical protein
MSILFGFLGLIGFILMIGIGFGVFVYTIGSILKTSIRERDRFGITVGLFFASVFLTIIGIVGYGITNDF